MIPLPHERPPAPGLLADRAATLRGALPVLQTARLRLDAPGLADFPVWADIMCSPRAAHMDGPYERAGAYTEFSAMLGAWVLHGRGVFALRTIAGGTALGFVCLNMEPGDQEPELGFFITADAEGHGYATEAAAAVRDWARGQGLASLVSYIAPANRRSVALAGRLGSTRDTAEEAHFAATADAGIAIFRHWGAADR